MKAICIIVTFLLTTCQRELQVAHPEEALIRGFISYVNNPNWDLDTVDLKYIVAYPKDTVEGAKARRQKFLKLQVIGLKNHLKGVNLDSLKVTPYNIAPKELQTLSMKSEFTDRSYVVTDSKSFVRYILVKDNAIHSFDFWEAAYWLWD